MLELKHISYSVREADETLGILKDISLTVDDHKLVVFTGPNGGGKTTLAKIIMGLVTPTEGQILWNGQDVTHMTITERAKLRRVQIGCSKPQQQPLARERYSIYLEGRSFRREAGIPRRKAEG